MKVVEGDSQNYFFAVVAGTSGGNKNTPAVEDDDDDWLEISRRRMQKQREREKSKAIENYNQNFGSTQSFDHIPIPDVLQTRLYSPKNTRPKIACPSCGEDFGRTKPRFCYYTGKYYCAQCHNKDITIIPARVIHKWDFSGYAVCNFALVHLKNTKYKPILRIIELNKDLYLHQKQLKEVLYYRKRIRLMGPFIHSCRRESDLLEYFESKEYMLDDEHIYSMLDLVQHQNKHLIPWLSQLYSNLAEHICVICDSCRGKGYYCEICNKNEVIFPFQTDLTTKCLKCNALFHRKCFVPHKVSCPKCARTAAIRAKK